MMGKNDHEISIRKDYSGTIFAWALTLPAAIFVALFIIGYETANDALFLVGAVLGIIFCALAIISLWLTPALLKKSSRTYLYEKTGGHYYPEFNLLDINRKGVAAFFGIVEYLGKSLDYKLWPKWSIPEDLKKEIKDNLSKKQFPASTADRLVRLILRHCNTELLHLSVCVKKYEEDGIAGSWRIGDIEDDGNFSNVITFYYSESEDYDDVIFTGLHECAHKILATRGIYLSDTLMNEYMTDIATLLLGLENFPEVGLESWESRNGYFPTKWLLLARAIINRTFVGYASFENNKNEPEDIKETKLALLHLIERAETLISTISAKAELIAPAMMPEELKEFVRCNADGELSDAITAGRRTINESKNLDEVETFLGLFRGYVDSLMLLEAWIDNDAAAFEGDEKWRA